MDKTPKTTDILGYYTKKIQSCKDDEVALDSVRKMNNIVGITAKDVLDTGAYKIMHMLSLKSGKLGQKALQVFQKWNTLVSFAKQHKESSSRHLEKPTDSSKESHTHRDIRKDVVHRSKNDLKITDVVKQSGDYKNLHQRDVNSGHTHQNQEASSSKIASVGKHHENREILPTSHGLQTGKNQIEAGHGHPSRNISHGHLTVGHSHQTGNRNQQTLNQSHQTVGLGQQTISHGPQTSNRGHQMTSTHGHSTGNRNHQTSGRGNHSVSHGHQDANHDPQTLNQSHQTLNHGQETANHSHISVSQNRLSADNHSFATASSKHYYPRNIDTVSPTKKKEAPSTSSIIPPSKSGKGQRDSWLANHNGDSDHLDIYSEFNPHLSIEDSEKATSLASGLDENASEFQGSKSKIHEPYYIEMKEGMFRVVRIEEGKAHPPDSIKERLKFHKDLINGVPYEVAGGEKREPASGRKSPSNSDKTRTKLSLEEYSKRGNGTPEKSTKNKNLSPNIFSAKNSNKRKSSPMPDTTTPEKKLRVEGASSADGKLKFSKSFKNSPPSHIKHPHVADVNPPVCDKKPSKIADADDESAKFICSKKERRAIYSGKKNVQDIPKLKELCIRYLKKNTECIRPSRQLSYKLLKPILEHLEPPQLNRIEEQNKHLQNDTQELWKLHCKRKFRTFVPNKHESWKSAYWRAEKEVNKKLKNLITAATVSASSSKSRPERQVKMTDVDPNHGLHRRKKADSPKPPVKSSSPSKVPKSDSPKKPKLSLPEAVKPHIAKTSKKSEAPLMSKVKKTMGLFTRNKIV